jgi:hypothetical protein
MDERSCAERTFKDNVPCRGALPLSSTGDFELLSVRAVSLETTLT